MKIKPIYIYLGVFAAFIVAFIIFSGDTKKNVNAADGMGQMPNDEIHQGMGGSASGPSSSNVKDDTRKRFEDLRVAYEKNPADTANAKQYAEMLAMAHQPDKAMELYENILKSGPKRSDILLELTFLNFNAGNLDKAEEYTNKMLAINANDQYAVYNLGIIAHAKGDNVKAKKQFQETIKKFPGTQVAKDADQLLKEIDKPKK
jgi:tetratricopeptide (TPR) repeat protein